MRLHRSEFAANHGLAVTAVEVIAARLHAARVARPAPRRAHARRAPLVMRVLARVLTVICRVS